MKTILLSILLTSSLTSYAASACLLEGSYSLQMQPYSHSVQPAWLNGYIGREYVNWHIMFANFDGSYEISDNFGGNWVRLKIETDRHSLQMRLKGWIGRNYIDWPGNSGWFTGYTPCLPK